MRERAIAEMYYKPSARAAVIINEKCGNLRRMYRSAREILSELANQLSFYEPRSVSSPGMEMEDFFSGARFGMMCLLRHGHDANNHEYDLGMRDCGLFILLKEDAELPVINEA